MYITPGVSDDSSAVTHSHSINVDKDWIIKVLSLNKVFKFSDYKTTNARCQCGNKKYTAIRSFSVNGSEEKSIYYNLPR